MTKRLPFRASVVLIFVLTGGFTLSGAPWSPRVAHGAGAKTVTLAVEGMTCPSCTFAVKAALKKVDGVEAAEVSFRDKRAVVTYDPARVGPEALAEAVDKTGFHATLPPPGDK